MNNYLNRPTLFLAVSAVLICAANASVASEFPNAPVKIVVPFSPGGTTDILARIIADGMSQQLGKSVVVENRPGATGIIGTEAVVRAKKDGYTLGLATVSSHSANPAVRKLNFDVLKDLTPVINIANAPSVLSVRPGLPVKNLQELLDLAKREPGKYTFGLSGLGSVGHLKMEQLRLKTGAKFLEVPYQGISAALQDVMAERIDVVSDDLPSSLPYITTGRLKVVTVASPKRLPVMPNVPTFEELGFPEMNRMGWFGLVAPAGTPKDVIAKLNEAANKAIASPKTKEAISKLFVEPAGGTPEAYGELMKNDLIMYRKIAEKVNIKLD